MSSGAGTSLKWLAGVVAVSVGLPLLLVYAVYWYAAKDLPESLPRASRAYPEQIRRLYWQVEQRSNGQPVVRGYGPVGMLWATFSREGGEWNPSVALPGHGARVVEVPAGYSQGRRQLRDAALAVRLGKERTASELIDLVLDRAPFAGGTRGLAAAAQRNYGVPPEALAREEALALVVTMLSPTRYSPHCPQSGFKQRFLKVAQQQGLPADAALLAAMHRLRPLPCHA
jgi:hypothetical protein